MSDLRPSRSVLRMFDRTVLPTLGMLTAKLTHPHTQAVVDVDFYVTVIRDKPVLGIDACRRLGMLRIVEENICEVVESSPSPSPSTSGRVTEATILDRYADLFDGALGLMEGDVHLFSRRDVGE